MIEPSFFNIIFTTLMAFSLSHGFLPKADDSELNIA